MSQISHYIRMPDKTEYKCKSRYSTPHENARPMT